jgi:asparagine synthase (glutamine-hydrolysing)
MSGIFGVLDTEHKTDIVNLINTMAVRLTHREWFVARQFADPKCGIALGQIGIGIFNTAPQPVWNADHTIALVMVGEFYNRAALEQVTGASGDEQIALALYEKQGKDFVCGLDGAFVIAIWDARQNCLWLCNDRFALYPTFTAQVGKRFVFAPEMKAILVDRGVSRALRDDATAEYFRFQHLLGYKTFFRDVMMFPPATILRCDGVTGAVTTERYWDIRRVAPLPASTTFEEAVEEVTRLFRAALAKMTHGSHRIGVFLSGGLDGRSIVGLLPSSVGPIHTFTFGQVGCRDEVYARQIARVARAQHHYDRYENGNWVKEWADFHLTLTEGFHSWIHMHGLTTLSEARQHVDVNISGLGDLLWTQPNFVPRHLVNAPDDIAFNSILFELYSQKYTWPGITCAEEKYLYTEAFYPRVRDLAFESFCNEVRAYDGVAYPQRVFAFNIVNHFLRYIIYAGIFGRAYIEYRFPYFDHDLISFCYALPYDLGYDRRLQKAMLLKAAPAFARVPTTDDELPIVAEGAWTFAPIAQKLKHAVHKVIPPLFGAHPTLYADYEQWLRTDLRTWAEGILFDERTRARGIYREEALRSLWARHLSGHELWTIGKIAPVISFELMLRQLQDETPKG